jgi:hypothetical protein
MKTIFLFIFLAFVRSQNITNETEAILPTLLSELFLPNDDSNNEDHHWIGMYKYKEDNSTFIILAHYRLFHQHNRNESAEYEVTQSKITLTPLEFRKLFIFLALSSKESMEIINSVYAIHIHRSNNPFYVSILKKTGRFVNENWRGIVLDLSEIKEILRSGSHLLDILGL